VPSPPGPRRAAPGSAPRRRPLGGGVPASHRGRRPVVSHRQRRPRGRHRTITDPAAPARGGGRASVAARPRRVRGASPMSAMPHARLAPALRALKLTGMLDTLDARLAEARAGTLGHVEFLQVLCQDEVARREAAAVARRLRAARLPTAATLESFDFACNPKLPVATIRDLARLEFIAAGESICIYGPVGVGKTHIAIALAHQACRRGHDVAFFTCSRLLAELAGGHADNSFTTRLRRLAKPAVLIVDDFAMREFSATQADDFYELLCERL